MTKKLNLNNKKNGGNNMKKVRIWKAAKELGVSSQEMMMLAGKHHWLCTITEEKFNKIKEEITMKNMIKNMKEERNKARGGKGMKKYLINVTKINKIKNKNIDDMQKKAYEHLSYLLDFDGEDITFAYPANKCQGKTFFDTCQECTKTFDDENGVYKIKVYEYEETCKDVHVHDVAAWVELCSSFKLYHTMKQLGHNMNYLLDDIDEWEDVVYKKKTAGGINQAVFRTNSSKVKLVEEIISEYGDGQFIFDELSKKYNMVLDLDHVEDDWDISMFQPAPEEKKETKQEAMAHILSLEDEGWDLLEKYLVMDKHGFIYSKKTGRALTYKELMISLDWVNKRRA